MKHIFSRMSTIAIILSLMPEKIFSMDPEPEKLSGSHPTLKEKKSLSSRENQEEILRKISNIKKDNPDKSPSELVPLINDILKTTGMRLSGQDLSQDTMHVNTSHLPANFRYPSFKDAFFDLRKRLPGFIASAQTFAENHTKGSVSAENFFRLVDGYLQKVSLPFVLSFENRPNIAFLDCPPPLTRTLPAALLGSKPITREGRELQADQAAAAAETLKRQALDDEKRGPQADPQASAAAEAPDDEDREPKIDQTSAAVTYHSEAVGIPELMCISEEVSLTRIGLLCLKAKHASTFSEKERALQDALDTYSNFLDSAAIYEQNAVNTIVDVKSSKLRVFSGLKDAFEKCKDLYASLGKYEEYAFTCNKILRYSKNNFEDCEFIFRAISQKSKDFDKSKMGFIEALSSVFNLSFQQIKVYETLEAERFSREIKLLMEEMRNYRALLKSVDGKKSARYKEMGQVLQDLTPHSSQKVQNPALADARSKKRLDEALDALSKETLIPRHADLYRSLQTNLRRQDLSLAHVQAAEKEIRAFVIEVLKKEVSFPLALEDVSEFYSTYFKGIMSNAIDFYEMTKIFLKVFITLDQHEEALTHLNAFRTFYKGIDGEKIFKDLEILEAICLAALGNPSKLLGFQERYQAEKKKLDEEKALREKGEKETLKRIIDERQKQAEQREKERDLKRASAQKSLHMAPPFVPSSLTFQDPPETTASREQEREQKEGRHKERKLQREKKRQETIQQKSGAVAASDNDEDELPNEISEATKEDPAIPFEEFFSLTKSQRKVEEQIQRKTWKITPDELERYYESFGCITRQRGSHTTPSLPSYNIVNLPNGEVLTVAFDIRSLDPEYRRSPSTFANWEGPVPFYLRNQILDARKRIQTYYTLLSQQTSVL